MGKGTSAGITVILTPADIEAIASAVVRQLCGECGQPLGIRSEVGGGRRAAMSLQNQQSQPQLVMLRDKEAADVLGTTRKTLETWRCKGKGPKFVKIGRAVRYTLSDLQEYVQGLQSE